MVNRIEAARLYMELVSTLSSLDSRLFESTEGEYLGVDSGEARRAVGPLVTTAGDLLHALANLDPTARSLRQACSEAALRASRDPFEVIEVLEEGPASFLPAEEYRAPLEFRALADRLSVVYGLQASPEDYVFSSDPQKLLYRMCGEIGETVEHLVKKRVISVPSVTLR